MTSIHKGVEEYLRLRRTLGFKLDLVGPALLQFADFLREERARTITVDLAVRWATQRSDVQPAQWANRLTMVRGFARYWSAWDPRTQVAPTDLLRYRRSRRVPYIYSDDEVVQLTRAAAKLRSRKGLRRSTYSTLFGLLAATGLRHGEALRLDRSDVDLDGRVLTIQGTKFGKTRLVPVHDTTIVALQRYARRRDRLHAVHTTSRFFVTEQGRPFSRWASRAVFVRLCRQIGLLRAGQRGGPRLHDLRHAFAVKTLVRWYREGLDVDKHVYELTTYLGHGSVVDTYWYFSAVPELLALAGARLERTLGGLP